MKIEVEEFLLLHKINVEGVRVTRNFKFFYQEFENIWMSYGHEVQDILPRRNTKVLAMLQISDILLYALQNVPRS